MTATHTTFPNKLEAFFLVAALITLEIIVSSVLRQASLLDGIDWQGVSGFITVVGNGLLFIFLMAYKRLSYRSLFHPTSNSVVGTVGVVVVPMLMVVPGLFFLMGLLSNLVQSLLPMSEAQQDIFTDMEQMSAIPVVFTCIVAPLLEEMLFRGVILRSFLHQYSRKEAILWSALIFGLAHMNAYQLVTAFVLGAVLGWLYERTRSLWPSILLHATFNTLVTLSANGVISKLATSIVFLAAALVCAVAGGLLLFHLLESVGAHRSKSRDS
jgi:uncharacterized protein